MSTLLRVGAVSLLVSLACSFLLLLLGLPLLADLLELFGSSLGAVRLHGDVRVQVVQSTIRLFTTVPAALVHALDFFVSPTWSLVLLCARNGNE